LISDSYWIARLRRHVILAGVAAATVWLAYLATPPPDVRHRISLSTAYAAMLFLAVSLSIGPWNILRRKPNPVSFDLRRDWGIWAGMLAIVHTAVGLTVHLRGRMWTYFFKRLHPLAIQNTTFGFANYTGLVAALLFLLLLAISNDLSLRSLGMRRWKSLQRWTYVAFGLTLVHAIAFQIVEKRRLPWLIVFGILSVTALVFQTNELVRTRRAARAARRMAHV